MNVWGDGTARNAIVATSRKRLIVAGFLTEARVSFPVLSARTNRTVINAEKNKASREIAPDELQKQARTGFKPDPSNKVTRI
jgi:hypothetical protein